MFHVKRSAPVHPPILKYSIDPTGVKNGVYKLFSNVDFPPVHCDSSSKHLVAFAFSECEQVVRFCGECKNLSENENKGTPPLCRSPVSRAAPTLSPTALCSLPSFRLHEATRECRPRLGVHPSGRKRAWQQRKWQFPPRLRPGVPGRNGLRMLASPTKSPRSSRLPRSLHLKKRKRNFVFIITKSILLRAMTV